MSSPLPAHARVTRVLRLFYTTTPPQDADVPGFVRGASAIRWWAGRLVVAQDDVHALALIDVDRLTVEPLLLDAVDGQRTFGDSLGNKRSKFDLEASMVLPDGRLVVFGSGSGSDYSSASREHVAVLNPTYAPIIASMEPEMRHIPAFYAALRAEKAFSGAELNLEGVERGGDSIWLFQRGNGASAGDLSAHSAIARMDADDFVRYLDIGGDAPPLHDVRVLDLGDANGVPYAFTDAVALPDGRMAFLAVAEDSPNTYLDGVNLGVRIGVLDGDRVHSVPIVDQDGQPSTVKFEGIAYCQTRGDVMTFWLVDDSDDETAASSLYRLDVTMG